MHDPNARGGWRARLPLVGDVASRVWHARRPVGIVCHRHRLIYFPVTKSACTTVKRIVARIEGLPADGNPHFDIPFTYVRSDALHLHPDYARLTVVRSPFDRLVSCFKDKIQGRPRAGQMIYAAGVAPGFERYNRVFRRKLFRPDMSFERFVRIIAWIPDLAADAHFRSQHRLFCAPDGTLLVNQIIHFDRLHDDLPAFLAHRGAEIEPMERRPQPDYADYYTPELRELAARRYQRDLEIIEGDDVLGLAPAGPLAVSSAEA